MTTLVADIVVPEVFTPYGQWITEEKSRIVQSGALVRDGLIDALLAGGGLTFKVPSYFDLPQNAERTADETTNVTTHEKITADDDIVSRINRNQSWSASTLSRLLAGIGQNDPVAAIASRVGTYWALRLQKAVIAVVSGINKDNGANDSGDYAFEIVGASFVDGVTNFSAEAQIDAAQTMGDSSDDLAMILVHSTVFARMKKNNLIDFIPDSEGRVVIPTYLGAIVVQDDGMPSGTAVVRQDGSAGVSGMFESWMFGPGALTWGVNTPPNATSVETKEEAGNGASQEILWNRVQWGIHFPGHEFIMPSIPNGGPSNGDLNTTANWNRVANERKQIKFARLITRES